MQQIKLALISSFGSYIQEIVLKKTNCMLNIWCPFMWYNDLHGGNMDAEDKNDEDQLPDPLTGQQYYASIDTLKWDL